MSGTFEASQADLANPMTTLAGTRLVNLAMVGTRSSSPRSWPRRVPVADLERAKPKLWDAYLGLAIA